MVKYEDLDWKQLPEDVRKAAELLGYTKKMWDHDKEPKLVKDSDWDDLTKEQQAAATVLGYTAGNWSDDDSSSDEE